MKISRTILLWLVVAGFSWLLGCLWTANLSLELSWIRSIYQKKITAVEEFKSEHRIFVVGGSGVHMGIDTQIMSEQLNRPIINLGLHAGLGIEAIISSIKPYLQEGDIILLIPEYDIITDEDGMGRLAGEFGFLSGLINQMDITLEQKTQSLLNLGNPSLKSLYATMLKFYKKGFKYDYYTNQVDVFGNQVELKTKNITAQMVKQQPPSKNSIKRIENFKEYINSKDAYLIIGLPWFLTKDIQKSKENVREFIKQYEQLAPTIYDNDYNLKTDKKLFGDTVYHLSYEGRKKRSYVLVKQLRPLID